VLKTTTKKKQQQQQQQLRYAVPWSLRKFEIADESTKNVKTRGIFKMYCTNEHKK